MELELAAQRLRWLQKIATNVDEHAVSLTAVFGHYHNIVKDPVDTLAATMFNKDLAHLKQIDEVAYTLADNMTFLDILKMRL